MSWLVEVEAPYMPIGLGIPAVRERIRVPRGTVVDVLGRRIPVRVCWFPQGTGLWMWWDTVRVDGVERVRLYPYVQWHRGTFEWEFTPAGDWPGAKWLSAAGAGNEG